MLVRGDREPAAVNTTSEDQQTNASPPPAPRGSPSPSPPTPELPRFRPTRGWILFAVALLFFNFYIGSRATEPASRVRVPYSPFFLNQVSAGHVEEITSKGTAIQGTFKEKQQYAANQADDEVPHRNSRVCQQRRPVGAASAEGRGRERPTARLRAPLVAEPSARFRADDSVHLPALLADAAGGQRSERPRVVRPLARPPVPTGRRPRHVRRRGRHRRSEGGAVGGRRLPAPSGEVPEARRPDSARRAPLGPTRHREDVARAGGRG